MKIELVFLCLVEVVIIVFICSVEFFDSVDVIVRFREVKFWLFWFCYMGNSVLLLDLMFVC